MRKSLFRALSAILLIAPMIALPAAASAAVELKTITFDDIDSDRNGVPMEAGYAGLNWDNFYSLDTAHFPASGFVNGAVSGTNVAYNGYGTPASFSSNTPFTLASGSFTGAWNNGLTITATGYGPNGTAIGVQSFKVIESGPTLHDFGWNNLSSVTFQSGGGTLQPGLDGSGSQFALDNLKIGGISSPSGAPEPASWAMMAIGLGGIGFAMRRRAGGARLVAATA